MKNVTSETAFRENLLHNLRGLKRAVTRPVAINIEDVAVQQYFERSPPFALLSALVVAAAIVARDAHAGRRVRR